MSKKLLVVLVSFVSVFFALASGTEEAEKVGSADSNDADGSGSSVQAFAIGDIIELGNLRLTVNALNDPQVSDNEFEKPEEGKKFVSVDLTVENVGTESETFSYLLAFELQDADAFTYSPSFSSIEPQAPDGEFGPSSKKRGLVVFEVPETSTELTLQFAGDIWSSGSAYVKLS